MSSKYCFLRVVVVGSCIFANSSLHSSPLHLMGSVLLLRYKPDEPSLQEMGARNVIVSCRHASQPRTGSDSHHPSHMKKSNQSCPTKLPSFLKEKLWRARAFPPRPLPLRPAKRVGAQPKPHRVHFVSSLSTQPSRISQQAADAVTTPRAHSHPISPPPS
jgi:hypothetical protein